MEKCSLKDYIESANFEDTGFCYTLSLISGKYKMIILYCLMEYQPVRFNKLQRYIGKISDKTLSQNLKELEKDELIHREVYPQIPPNVQTDFANAAFRTCLGCRSYHSALSAPMPPNYIPNLIHDFFEKNKKINIESYAAATSAIINDLKNDKIEFGFCSDSETGDEEIEMIPLMEYPIKLVVNKNDPLCDIDRVSVKDLMTEPGISYTEGSVMDRKIELFFKEHDITPDIHYRTSSEEIQNFVSCGLGWALIAQNGVPMMEGLKILEIPELVLKRNTYLAMRKDRKLSKTAQKFLQYVLSYNEKFI